MHVKASEQFRGVSGGVTRVLSHHRGFEEETSDNEAAVEEEEEEGEEDVFAEKSSPDMEECSALKVRRARGMEGNQLSVLEKAVTRGPWLHPVPRPQGSGPRNGTAAADALQCPCL